MNVRRAVSNLSDGPLGRQSESAQDREILSQTAFHRVISIERRRTERSRKPFLLMLLDMGNHLSSETSGKNVNKLLAALAVATRETDIPGWYETDRIVGVMFTEICFDDRETIVSTMIARLSDILRNNLSLEQFNRVSISFHVFPEDWDQDSRKPSNPVLYPDLSKQADKKRASGALKRAMDIVGSSLALFLAAPMFLLIAIAVKASSTGPVFFRQRRLGQHGEPFTFLKFRSMKAGNDSSVHKEYIKKLISGKCRASPTERRRVRAYSS